MTRYAYLGPAGTFTQMALHAWAPALGAEHVPLESVPACLAAVRADTADAAVVPIENSVEGGVTATLDSLTDGTPLVVVGEVLVPVTFVLAARAGTRLQDVTAIGTHSHAWAQVRGYVATHLGEATFVPTLSTAAGPVALGEGAQSYQATVCAPIAAEQNGLAILAHDIGDITQAVTRFVVVARPGSLPAATGADKTTVVLYQREDHAGGLLELLEQFATRGINMTRLESRPTKDSMGSYCFSIDLEGHVQDERVGDALVGLKRICAEVVFLGSYPRADRLAATIAPQASDGDYARARAWLEVIRAGEPAAE